VFVRTLYSDLKSGDTRQLYDPANADPGLRRKETHEPLFLSGLASPVQPGADTLLLVSAWNTQLDSEIRTIKPSWWNELVTELLATFIPTPPHR